MKIAVFANMNAGGGKAAAALAKIRKAWSGRELYGSAEKSFPAASSRKGRKGICPA